MADSHDSPVDVSVEDHLKYMIEVYELFLVQHLDCVELLPFMPFLRESAGRIRKLKRSGKPVESAELFFKSLKESDAAGRYAAFRDALNEADQEIVKTVLEGGSIDDYHDENIKLIEIFSKPISERLDPMTVIQHLRGKDILTERDESEIKSVHYRSDAVLMLLHCVFRRKKDWYKILMSVIYTLNPDLVKMVDPGFVEKRLALMSPSEKQTESGDDMEMTTMEEPLMEGIASGQREEAVYRLKHDRDNTEPTNQKSRMSHATGRQSSHRLSSEDHQSPLKGNSFKGNTRICDEIDCVHCTLRNEELQTLRSQMSDMQNEISDLKKILSQLLH